MQKITQFTSSGNFLPLILCSLPFWKYLYSICQEKFVKKKIQIALVVIESPMKMNILQQIGGIQIAAFDTHLWRCQIWICIVDFKLYLNKKTFNNDKCHCETLKKYINCCVLVDKESKWNSNPNWQIEMDSIEGPTQDFESWCWWAIEPRLCSLDNSQTIGQALSACSQTQDSNTTWNRLPRGEQLFGE